MRINFKRSFFIFDATPASVAFFYMNTTYTVTQAIKRGRRLIPFTVLALWLTSIFAGIFIGAALHQVPLGLLGFPIGTLIAFAYWQYATVKWKIWAYENVRNLHELKSDALKYHLIWPDGSVMQKLEIKSLSQKERIKRLERKFQQPDIFHVDLSVRDRTEIYKAKSTPYIITVFALLLVGIVIREFFYNPHPDKPYLHFITTLPFAIFLLYRAYKEFRTKGPHVVLSNEGIKLRDTAIIPWQQITSTQIKHIGRGKQMLVVNYSGTHTGTEINHLDKNALEIEQLIKVYKARFEKSRQSRF